VVRHFATVMHARLFFFVLAGMSHLQIVIFGATIRGGVRESDV
jgi:hypothetical protein